MPYNGEQMKIFDDGPNARLGQGPRPTGWDLAKNGMARVIQKAETLRPGWKAEASQWLRKFARNNPGARFTCEDVRQYAERNGFDKPHDSRAWGQVMRSAGSRTNPERFLSKAGIGNYKDPKCHRGLTTVWKSLY